ncbi:hypothetical protein PF005_g1976 [Phytophthora fragariae]|uniref:Uncharacterized protein n=1 Tax=Phytophthora fragariae TaxID=53985 RepID=A0A6A4EJY4_9STRA|nr:hypothetical protein PF003_g22353 [Phytophthora fragariae]KAE8948548.1 hypothetical protein PF009_g1878 [Phytophthora fragariae]KAE9138156.1 hypothetical protein PF007_g1526 [Phytophthora fragariae]KAE9153828.1 hypothetical protein PF006_g2080 [Phytophthora fragariae]KAE9234250.1 hypothetical protein PF005_g1976 [Phytophthora fragariae]
MIWGCWGLGVALYIISVWRWRVAPSTTDHHVAGLKTRLRNGYMDVAGTFDDTSPRTSVRGIGNMICIVLGADWEGPPGQQLRTGFGYLVAFAGSAAGEPMICCSGTLVVEVHLTPGTYAVEYMDSETNSGKNFTPL